MPDKLDMQIHEAGKYSLHPITSDRKLLRFVAPDRATVDKPSPPELPARYIDATMVSAPFQRHNGAEIVRRWLVLGDVPYH